MSIADSQDLAATDRRLNVKNRLKIGLLVDEELVPRYVHDLVVWAGQRSDLHISHLIIQKGCARQPGPSRIRGRLDTGYLLRPLKVLQLALWKMINRYEAHKLSQRGRMLVDALELHDIGQLIDGRIHTVPELSQSGFVLRFRREDIESIRREGFDLLIRAGSGILKGEILQSSRLGILSFHHGDNRYYRGGPAGFWEVYRRDARTGFSLQMLNEELDGGRIVARGNFPTQTYYLANVKILQERANQYLKAALIKIASTGGVPATESSVPYSGVLYRMPKTADLLRYAGMQTWRSLKESLLKRVGIQDRWHVAYSATGWRDAVLWRGIRIGNPEGRFFADPFVFDTGKAVYCYAEDYSYRTGKGRISVFEIHKSESRYVGVAIEEPYHLSFPFLFEFDGALYMCPETGGAGEIRVYKCTSLPLRWEVAAVLMPGVSAVDTMLFETDGRWWMLTNLDASQVGDRCAELHLFFADSPLSKEWTPHPLNPLIVDSGRGRNGGLILDGGRVFRVAQVHGGGNQYGACAQVFEITRLNAQEYEETFVCSLTPSFGPGIKGIHHMHTNGRYTVWDFRTKERVP